MSSPGKSPDSKQAGAQGRGSEELPTFIQAPSTCSGSFIHSGHSNRALLGVGSGAGSL